MHYEEGSRHVYRIWPQIQVSMMIPVHYFDARCEWTGQMEGGYNQETIKTRHNVFMSASLSRGVLVSVMGSRHAMSFFSASSPPLFLLEPRPSDSAQKIASVEYRRSLAPWYEAGGHTMWGMGDQCTGLHMRDYVTPRIPRSMRTEKSLLPRNTLGMWLECLMNSLNDIH